MEKETVKEGPLTTVEDMDIYPGSSYLIKGETPEGLYKLYNSLVDHFDQGLLISRTYPHKVINQYRVTQGTFVWMTTNTVGYSRCINPTNISMLHITVTDFLKSTPRGIISIDGIEYLVSNNGFDPILRLLHALNDKITVSEHILLVTIDEETLHPRDMRILEKDFEHAF